MARHQMDTGWAWVVLACSWMSLYLLGFMSSSAGILQVEIIEEFGVGSGPVSIMTAFVLGMSSLLGPVSGVFASFMSVRWTVFVGAVMMSFGMLGTSFSETLPMMMFWYGIVTAVGSGIVYSSVVTVISFYFEKYLMLANGLMLCAPGLGLLSVPHFVRYFIDNHGWRYTIALNGAVVLHIAVCASVFFPTETEKKNMVKFRCFGKKQTMKDGCDGEEEMQSRVGDVGDQERMENVTGCDNQSQHKQNNLHSSKYDMILRSGLLVDSSSLKSKSQSLSLRSSSVHGINKPYIPIYINGTPEIKRAFKPSIEISSHLCESPKNGSLTIGIEDMENGFIPAANTPFRPRTASELTTRSAASGAASVASQTSLHISPAPSTRYRFGQLSKDRVNRHSYLSSLGFVSSELGSALMLPIKIEELDGLATEGKKPSMLKQMKRICKHKAVWILSMNSLLFLCGLGIHSVHFPSYAESKGMSKHQVTQFYTAYGLILMTGRIAGGVVYNRVKPPLCILLFVLQILFGVFLGLAPFYANTAAGIFVLEAAVGLLYGQSFMILPALTAQIMGVKDLAIAFGIILHFLGVGYIASPIAAGYLYDMTKTFDIPFYIGGSVVVFSALTLILMVFVKKEADAGEEEEEIGEIDEQEKDNDKDKMDDKDKDDDERKEDEKDHIHKITPLLDEKRTN